MRMTADNGRDGLSMRQASQSPCIGTAIDQSNMGTFLSLEGMRITRRTSI